MPFDERSYSDRRRTSRAAAAYQAEVVVPRRRRSLRRRILIRSTAAAIAIIVLAFGIKFAIARASTQALTSSAAKASAHHRILLVDPVCKRTFDQDAAAGSCSIHGKTVYFDTEECLHKFVENPLRYAKIRVHVNLTDAQIMGATASAQTKPTAPADAPAWDGDRPAASDGKSKQDDTLPSDGPADGPPASGPPPTTVAPVNNPAPSTRAPANNAGSPAGRTQTGDPLSIQVNQLPSDAPSVNEEFPPGYGPAQKDGYQMDGNAGKDQGRKR